MDLHRLVERFEQCNIMVIGDVVADRSVVGRPERISREAPVLILAHERTEILPGGAANTMNNIRDLGAHVFAAGVVGRDEPGRAIMDALAGKGVDTGMMIVESDRKTVTKTRVWASDSGAVKQQVVRIDDGSYHDLSHEAAEKILDYARKCVDKLDAIVFSDYGYGTLPDWLVSELVGMARGRVIMTADSRYDLAKFKGVTVATPNKQESEAFTGKKLLGDAEVEVIGRMLCELIASEAMVITRGADGMSLVEADGAVVHIPAFNKTQVYDVTGAGDTVIGALSLALACGASFLEAALIANIAASIVVRKVGTSTVLLDELVPAVLAFENQLTVEGGFATVATDWVMR